MAEIKKPEDVRREALLSLAQARAGMSENLSVLNNHLNPVVAARSMMRKHPVAMVAVAVGAGLLLALAFTRRRPVMHARDVKRVAAAAERASRAATAQTASAPVKSAFGLMVAMGVKAALPMAGKAVMDYLQRRTSDSTGGQSSKP